MKSAASTETAKRKEPLTERQRETLNFIKGYIKLHGMPPTVAEIAAGFEIAQNAAQGHLVCLERHGWIAIRKHYGGGRMARGIQVL